MFLNCNTSANYMLYCTVLCYITLYYIILYYIIILLIVFITSRKEPYQVLILLSFAYLNINLY